MRTSLSLATAVILLLVLMAMEVEAIRLDAESRAAVSNQMVDKSSELENAVKASGDSLGETKRSVAAKEVRAAAHKLPEFHEDYYGPSDHKPRHH